jgi:hypothetical protein
MVKPTRQVGVRIDARLAEALELEATRDQRSLASLLRKVISDHIEDGARRFRTDTRQRARAEA